MANTEKIDDNVDKIPKITKNNDKSKSNPESIFINVIEKLNIKIFLFIILIGIFVFSDVFIDNILDNIDGASYNGMATTKGTIIQLLFLALFYLIFDLLVQLKVL